MTDAVQMRSSPSLLDAPSPPNSYLTQRKPRTARKPSPGLAARLKALGFGKDSSNSPSTAAISEPGRIPEEELRAIDERAKAIAASTIERRGRAWSGTQNPYTPPSQARPNSSYSTSTASTRTVEGRTRRSSSTDGAAGNEMPAAVQPAIMINTESQKYRLPEHTNGNGTKAMADTKLAHLERSTPPEDTDELPPRPISKDEYAPPDTPGEFDGDASSFFNPFGRQRPGSIYTLSRASFASQLAQLTSLQLPDAESLSSKINALPSSKAASRALRGAAEQIRSWISKASEVVSGLDGEDDVEWAAAGGREGLEEVDHAITRFEQLINVYVSAIESLQERPDIVTVPSDELTIVVLQVETILKEWASIRYTLRDVKNSVEIAMEWEELWGIVLGDIKNEVEVLARLVFEMEEKRHQSLMVADDDHEGIDIKDLDTIVEETPPSRTISHVNRPFSSPGQGTPNHQIMAHDDSSLLALFARMQPLRASLDFLPMRLSTFHARAQHMFPSACEELDTRREGLERTWQKLERDAESLRRELGEDRWVLVFRGAGRQAQKMYDSVERSVTKLRESVDQGLHLNNPAVMGKKIDSYEAKKCHYGPAIERVLGIIGKGVKDRLTVNGEILRLHSDMQRKWEGLKSRMNELDVSIDEIHADHRNQQLRDSISSTVSNDRFTNASYDTPGSSPASSVVMNGFSERVNPKTPGRNGKVRGRSSLPQPGGQRNSSNPTQPRNRSTYRVSTMATSTEKLSSVSLLRQSSATPTGNRPPDVRPRWNTGWNGTSSGFGSKPASLNTPSPARAPPSAHANRPYSLSVDSKLPVRNPLQRTSSPPAAERTPSRTSGSRMAFRDRLTSPGPYSQQVLSTPRPRTLTTQSSMLNLHTGNRRTSLQPMNSDPTGGSPSVKVTRPASSLATTRRSSLLPLPSQPRGRQSSNPMPARAVSRQRADSRASDKKPKPFRV